MLVSTLIHLNFVVAITVSGLSASAEVTPQLKGFLCIFIHGYKDIYSPVTSKPTQEFVSVTFHSYSALTHRQNIFKVQNGENKKKRKKKGHTPYVLDVFASLLQYVHLLAAPCLEAALLSKELCRTIQNNKHHCRLT